MKNNFRVSYFNSAVAWATSFWLSLVFAGCVSEPSAITGKDKSYGYTLAQEKEIGQTTDQQIIQQMGLYQDEELARYVQDLGARILAESDLNQPDTPEIYQDLKFTFRVMDSPVVNAFALPGGYVYVTRGLLSHINNEAQLAVILGHEITHVIARHASRQAVKQQWGQLGLMAGAIIGQELMEQPGFAEQFLDIGGSFFQMLTLKYSRDAERESDDLGVEYAAKAGYAVGEAAGFFRLLDRLSSGENRLPAWQSTHPDPGEREDTILKLAQQYDPDKTNRVGTETLMGNIDGIMIGENPRQGFTQKDRFYHPELKFSFPVPQGWRLLNESVSVTMMPEAGNAVLVFSMVQGNSPEEAASAFLNQSGIQPTAANETQIAGRRAFEIQATIQNQQGAIALLNQFVEFEGRLFSFLSYSTTQLMPGYINQFRSISDNLEIVTDPVILNKAPIRLKVITADREAPFQNFLRNNAVDDPDGNALAIMNQVDLIQLIKEGRQLKLTADN